MVQSIRYNANQLTKRKKYFKSKVDSVQSIPSKFVDYKKMSAAEFDDFKEGLKTKELQRQKRLAISFGSIMIIIVGVLIYFLFFY